MPDRGRIPDRFAHIAEVFEIGPQEKGHVVQTRGGGVAGGFRAGRGVVELIDGHGFLEQFGRFRGAAHETTAARPPC